jgi:hypothetical protein
MTRFAACPTQERSQQVQPEHGLREPGRHVGGRYRGAAARVVDQDIEPAVAFNHRRDRGGGLVPVPDVGGHKGQSGREILGRFPAADDHPRAGVPQAKGDAQPDVAGATGDERSLTNELRAAR